MLDLMHTLGAWSLPKLWLPLLAWTLAVLPPLALLRWTNPHPLVDYRARQALLFALPLGLGLASAVDWALPVSTAARSVDVTLRPPVVVSPVSPSLSPLPVAGKHALGGLTLVVALLAAWRLGRLVASARRLARYRHTLAADVPADLQATACETAQRLGIRRRFHLARAPGGAVPMTLGLHAPVVALPPGLARERLQMALTHELVHLRRRDDYAAWLEALVGAVFFAHPLCTRLRRQITESREAACDAAVLGDGLFSPRRYAHLLYAFADPGQPASLALPLAESSSSLKRRLRAMRHRSPAPSSSSVLALALALLLGVAAGLSACSDAAAPSEASRETSASTAEEGSPNAIPGTLPFSEVDTKPSLEGGPETIYGALRYPEPARADSVEGTVHVQFVVDTDGTVRNASVLKKGPAPSLNAEALRAVETLTFEPGQRDGQAVPVRMMQPIRFKLESGARSPSEDALE